MATKTGKITVRLSARIAWWVWPVVAASVIARHFARKGIRVKVEQV